MPERCLPFVDVRSWRICADTVDLVGARLEELAQLAQGDVRLVDGIWCLDNNDRDVEQLKNVQSQRLVPLHPKLIELGFLNHTLAANDRVFPELKPSGPDEKLGDDFGQKFTKYRRDIGVYERHRAFHSLRHTFVSMLVDKHVSDIVIASIVGHEVKTMTAHYARANPPSLRTKWEAIRLANWEEFPL